MTLFTSPWVATLQDRLSEKTPLIQILIGPRQVGKTTSLMHIMEKWWNGQCISASADDRQLLGSLWIEQHWERARQMKAGGHSDILLILDEIQKIENWSETVKRLWDEDILAKKRMKVVLSGSSALTIQTGLSESLAGRFEIISATHLSWDGFSKLTHRSVEDYIFFGGYPGSLQFISDETRWRNYINQSIIESILSKDILLLARIDKPALLRRLLQLGCEFSSQILSYQKAIGHLQDVGNTTTLAHYLHLLEQAFVLSGIQKIERAKFRKRSSSPKFQVHNTALMGAQGGYTLTEARERPEIWGRYLESAVGAHLLNCSRVEPFEVYYWREGILEVDFVIRKGQKLLGIEVKSKVRGNLSGLQEFKKQFPHAKTIVVAQEDIEEFLASSPSGYL